MRIKEEMTLNLVHVIISSVTAYYSSHRTSRNKKHKKKNTLLTNAYQSTDLTSRVTTLR